jgi:ABC-type transporter Mla maintaining outer membrane lipid asymmetry ATPase subunit MlaF/ABC-type transporter Mla maintaining outer membrane lipid asymmetry permease subunit MlaE
MTLDPVFDIEGLTLVTPAGKALLEDTHLTLGSSEVALLVGPSGSGKSTLIKLLSGLLGDDGDAWRVGGTLRHGGKVYNLARDRCDVGALVFQNYALFDDLSAMANLGIAMDHADSADPTLVAYTLDLLSDIDPDQTIASSSGGQRQRIAIARTLLANRPLLLFDEPNSGLDPYTAQRLGILIRDLCRRMGRPALIVAHHVDDLLPLVDTVYLLDTRARTLRPLPVDRDGVDDALLAVGQAEEQPPPSLSAVQTAPKPGAWQRRLKPHVPRRWFFGYLLEYFWILWGSPLMLLYIFSGAAIVGFVIFWFGFNYDLLGDAVRSFVHDDALVGLGFVEGNIAVPLICCILMVARNNAIITADIGNRVLSSQFLAMQNLHIPGRRYIISAILLNTLVGGLVLVGASLAVAGWTSFHTWLALFPDQPFELWQEHFFHSMLQHPAAWGRNVGWVVLKVLLSSACGALLAIRAGLAWKDSVIAVNYAIARSIVQGVTATLVIHAGIAVAVY